MQTDVNRPTASINKSILTEGLEILSELLSRHGLRITLQADSKGESPSFDAELKLLPKGPRLFVEAKQTFYPRSIQRWNEILHSKQDQGSHNLLLIVPHHTARSFAQCRENGIFTIDLDGNAYLEWPGFYTDRFNPSQRPKNKAVQGTVFTAKASRLIRALLVRYPRPWTQQELIEATAISPGYVSTRLRALERSRYIRREARRFIHVSDPDRLLNAWTETYRFDRHRKLRFALSATSYEQGIHKISTELHRLGIGFAYTGWSGSHIVSPYAESNEYMLYVTTPPPSSETKVLHRVEHGGNVTLLIPHDEGVFQFLNNNHKDAPTVCLAQLFVDLSNLSGRAPEAATQLREAFINFEESEA